MNIPIKIVAAKIVAAVVVVSMIGIFFGAFIFIGVHNSPPTPVPVVVESTPEPARAPCLPPLKFAVGDKIKSVLSKWTDEEGKEWPLIGQIITIDGINTKNRVCVYTVGHYSGGGEWIEDQMYEFEMVRF